MDRASADRDVVCCDFLDLTFYFSFADVAGELLQSYSACFRRLTGTAAQFARRRSGFEGADMCSPSAHLSGTERGTADLQLSRTQDHAPDGPPNLLLEYFFDLPDLLFNFAGGMFGSAGSL